MTQTRLTAVLATLFCCAVTSGGQAQETGHAAAQSTAYRDSLAQDQLRMQTDRLRQELMGLLDDYRQSHVSPAESAQLQQTIDRLGHLSDGNMNAVVQTLREAGKLNDPAGVQNQLVAASNEQRNIQAVLKTLTDLLTLRQTQEAVQQRLHDLVLRQTANLRHAREIAAAGQPIKSLPHELQAAEKLCVAEQTALGSETSLLVEALEKAGANANTDPNAALFAETLKLGTDLQLERRSMIAAADTNLKDFSKAANSQESLLMSLQALAEKMTSRQTVPERLRDLSARIRDLTAQQKMLADSTQAAKPSATTEIREQQRRLADQLAVLKGEVAAIDAATAAQLAPGEQALRSVDDLLKNPNALKDPPQKPGTGAAQATDKAQIANAQAEAARQLQAVSETLDRQADRLAPAANASIANAAQAAAALQQLGQEISQALAQQQALASQPATPASAAQQQQLAAAVANVQRQALPLDTAVANTLGQAASQMQQAQGAQAPDAANQAAASLAQAQKQIQREAQEISKAAAAQQALQGLIAMLSGAKAQASEAARIIGQPSISDFTSAVQQTQTAEDTVQQALVLVVRDGATLPPELKGDLNTARTDLTSSRMLAAQVQKKAALAANQHAQTELDAAIALLQQSSSQLLAQAMPSSALAQSQQQALAQAEQQRSQEPPLAQRSSQPQSGQPQKMPPAGRQQANPSSTNPSPGNPPPGSPPTGAQQQMAQGNDQSNDGLAPGSQASDTAKRDHYLASSGAATGYTMVNAGIKAQDRDAVTLFQKEKVPSEYSEMVQQYSRNLAEGVAPGK